jgi:hypothetical protein
MMKPKLLTLAVVLACASLQAQAVGKLADVTVVDRDSGATLPVHYYRGDYWVAGKPGARYAVSVRNKTEERLLTVPSVDGVNVLSGETAAWDQSGYVFAPNESYQITGWRKSNSEVAAFEFSNAGDSYAGRTGRPGNVGVIGVALFREKRPEPVAQAPTYSRRSDAESEQALGRLKSTQALPSSPPAPAAAPLAGLADRSAESTAASANRAPSSSDSLAKAAPVPSPKLGTAHGQREASVVSHTSFARLQPQPNEVIRIRYDSRENLIASGVLREPQPYPPRPNPFPESGAMSYVPDPPVRQY